MLEEVKLKAIHAHVPQLPVSGRAQIRDKRQSTFLLAQL